MKLFFNLFFMIYFITISEANSRSPIIITYKKKSAVIEVIKQILAKDLNIPKILVQEKIQSSPCRPIEDVIMQICINEKKEIKFPRLKNKILKNNYSVFLKMGGKND